MWFIVSARFRRIPFFVEETRFDCIHACTVDDLATVLELIPMTDWRGLAAIVLRQPKRKEQILRPVWGRISYDFYFGRSQEGTAIGPVVTLDAQSSALEWRRPKPMNPADAAEVDRLIEDGHAFEPSGKGFRVVSSLDAIRATQLYRSLPHEIGHLLDYTSDCDGRYWDRPYQEREAFAHRYADETRQRLRAAGHIPFPAAKPGTPMGSVLATSSQPQLTPASSELDPATKTCYFLLQTITSKNATTY